MPPLTVIDPGTRYGRLVVNKSVGTKKVGTTFSQFVLVRCDCGAEKVVAVNSLKTGKTRSCGCLQKQTVSATNWRHGHSVGGKHSYTYTSWNAMMNRCSNVSHRNYHLYGGRGITVCERWHSFQNFLEDMGDRPPNFTLERINNDGNYEPTNCRWVTKAQNNASGRRRPKRKTT